MQVEKVTKANLQEFRDEMIRLHAEQSSQHTDKKPGCPASFDPVRDSQAIERSHAKPGTNSRVRAVKTIRPSRDSNLYV
jgi:hypothetical protein